MKKIYCLNLVWKRSNKSVWLRDVFYVMSSGDDKVKMIIKILYELPLKRMHNPLNHDYSKLNPDHRTWRFILRKD